MAFTLIKAQVRENLTLLEEKLEQAIRSGFLDDSADYYNLLYTLDQDVKMATSWDEISEVIYKGKTLEEDLDAWLSRKGYTTISLSWPANTKYGK